MKKILIVLLATTLTVSLASCSKDEGDVTGSVETSAQTSAENEEAFEKGGVSQQTYKNEFIGIGCTLDDDWTFYDDEKIAQLNGLASDAMDEEVAEMIANATIIYDMFAENTATAENVNINLEKLTRTKVLMLDIETMFKSQTPSLKSTYENMGSTEFSYTIGKISFVGKDQVTMKIKAKINGVDMYQTMVALKTGQYLTNICATSYQTDTTEEVLGKFFSLGNN